MFGGCRERETLQLHVSSSGLNKKISAGFSKQT